jgi:carbonic anhydrase
MTNSGYGYMRITGDQALKKLLAGNERYREARPERPNQTLDRRREVADGQRPFAVILGCSDSRVPPEIIFDQGLGDLFIVRVAGGVVDNMVLGSIEYAVSHLKTPLIVVLGHSNCGAVTATLSGHHELPGQLGSVTVSIQPAVDLVGDQPGDRVNRASKANAKMIAERLRNSKPVLFNAIQTSGLLIAAAYYNLSTGSVEILLQ